MKKIDVKSWEAEYTDPVTQETIKKQEDTMEAIKALMAKTKEGPVGIDRVRLFNRIGSAFEKAKDTKVIELEDADYEQVLKILEKEMPAKWGLIPKVYEAMKIFMDAKNQGAKE